MRTVCAVAATLIFALLGGCSQGAHRLAAVDPSPEELPKIQLQNDSYVQASIQTERDPGDVRVVLVPQFKEPPLTKEEKEATGKYDPPYRLLPYELTIRKPGYLRGPYVGLEVSTGPYDRHIGVGTRDVAARAGAAEFPNVGVDPFVVHYRGIAPPTRSAYSGPEEHADVGIGDTKEHAHAKQRRGE